MTRIKAIGLVFLIEGAILCAGVGIGVYILQRPAPATGEIKEIVVEPGMTVSQVADTLRREGLLRNVYWFRLLAQYRRVDTMLHVGRYRFETGMPAGEILEALATGEGGTQKVTIPEGLTILEIARILREQVDIDSTRFVAMASDPAVAREMGIDAPTLEGYLFPETYSLYRHMRPGQVIREMTAMFRRVFNDEFKARAGQMGFSVHEIVTLASIVEEEAQLAEERPIIAGVFYNRLKRGYLLQADPTVKYGLGQPNMQLYEKHLSDPSPYNTYVHSGLPPGPICSPGAAAIHAALHPQDVPYLYFVARGDGSHIFSRSNEEHNNAKLRVKRGRRKGNKRMSE